MILSIIPARLDGAEIGDSVYTRAGASQYVEIGTEVVIEDFDADEMMVAIRTLEGLPLWVHPTDLSTNKPFKVGDIVRDEDFLELPIGTTVASRTVKGIWQVINNSGGMKTIGNTTVYSAEELIGTIIWMPDLTDPF